MFVEGEGGGQLLGLFGFSLDEEALSKSFQREDDNRIIAIHRNK